MTFFHPSKYNCKSKKYIYVSRLFKTSNFVALKINVEFFKKKKVFIVNTWLAAPTGF